MPTSTTSSGRARRRNEYIAEASSAEVAEVSPYCFPDGCSTTLVSKIVRKMLFGGNAIKWDSKFLILAGWRMNWANSVLASYVSNYIERALFEKILDTKGDSQNRRGCNSPNKNADTMNETLSSVRFKNP
jgi:hypothetical protein